MRSPEIYSYKFFKNKKIADNVMLRESFSLSRIPKQTKAKMLDMIKNGYSLNKISNATGLGKTTIYYYSRKINGKKYFEPEFKLEYSELEGEIAGIFTGDGSQYHDSKRGHYEVNVHFGNTDYSYYVKDLFENYFNKEFRLYNESRGRQRLRTLSKPIFHHFKNYLEYDSKVKHSTVRLKTLKLPDNFLIGFLRGLLDTDGTIALPADRKMRIVYTTTSKNLAWQLKSILAKFDVNSSHYVAKPLSFKEVYHVYILARSNALFLHKVKPFKSKQLGARSSVW